MEQHAILGTNHSSMLYQSSQRHSLPRSSTNKSLPTGISQLHNTSRRVVSVKLASFVNILNRLSVWVYHISAWGAVQDDSTAWERWVYLFAQIRQLGVLAPVLPTANPQLRRSAYEMVLHAFLLSPADHAQLLHLLKSWPTSLYSIQSMTATILQRCVLSSSSTALETTLYSLENQLHTHHGLARSQGGSLRSRIT